MQLKKEFHTHYYQLYKKGMTHTMVSLQGLHSGDTLRCPNISASMGLKSFCPWCHKLSRNTETITIHLCEVHLQMAIACKICWALAGMTAENILDHQLGCNGKHDNKCTECDAHEGHGKEQKSHKLKKKTSKSWGQKGASELLRSDAAKKSH